MTITAVQAAAMARLEAVTGRPDTVWPNEAETATTPRLEVFEGPVAGAVAQLNGASDQSSMLQVDVVVEENSFTDTMRTEVQRVVDAFPPGQALGSAWVSGPPEIGGYRQDGAEYRCSITIPYRMVI